MLKEEVKIIFGFMKKLINANASPYSKPKKLQFQFLVVAFSCVVSSLYSNRCS